MWLTRQQQISQTLLETTVNKCPTDQIDSAFDQLGQHTHKQMLKTELALHVSGLLLFTVTVKKLFTSQFVILKTKVWNVDETLQHYLSLVSLLFKPLPFFIL